MSEQLTREEKIKVIQDIKNGTPARFALNPRRYSSLELDWKKSSDCYYTMDGEAVSFEDKEKYLLNAMIFVSVAGMTRQQIKEYEETGIYPKYEPNNIDN